MSKIKTTTGVIVSILISLAIIVLLSITHLLLNDNKVNEVYDVYIDGDLVGTIKSKSKLEKYIDSEQSDLKKEYGVNKVYIPNGIDIQKVMRYDNKLVSEKEIYKEIKSKKSFSIKGYVVTISPKKSEEEQNEETPNEELALDETGHIQNDDIVLYLLHESDFDKAVKNVLYVFENKEKVSKYVNKKQEKIITTGSTIDNIYIDQDVTIKEAFISTDEQIFNDASELTKYLLFGSLNSKEEYTVKLGDTIESIAYDHKLNVDEFLIVNPEFTSKNNLLTIGQTVNVALISPIVKIVVEKTIVEDVDKPYETISENDNTMYIGNSKVKTEGVNGIQRITSKTQYVNGQEQPSYIMNATVIKEPVNKVVLVGTKAKNYYEGGVPAVTTGIWGWPTISPYKITSPFGYRWGRFHQGIDISGTGFGSPIYAIGEGTVLDVYSGCPDQGYYGSSCGSGYGNHIWIKHNENVYVVYSHIAGRVLVGVGQTVHKGQQVGFMANSGSSTGTHLHFGTYYGGTQYGKYGGGKAFNPLELYK
ncbi:MAG: M23 family metallopeptidase [Bacilli bacterium]|nr:M23 family metallopeptidase [Bacilli bacterium]MBR6113490.1 M23 family metallopeptidase [Bacilli bacterium]